MVERQKQIKNTEKQVIEVFDKINGYAVEYGEPYGEKGRKAFVVFDTATNSEINYASASLFAGHVQSEVKLIYETRKITGSYIRSEFTFRKNGSSEKRILKGMYLNGFSALEPILIDKNIKDTDLSVVNNLLFDIEKNLRNPALQAENKNILESVNRHHIHMIRTKKVNKKR